MSGPNAQQLATKDIKSSMDAKVAENEARKAEAELKRVQALREQGLDSRGLPLRPEFESIFEQVAVPGVTGGIGKGAITKDGDRLREGFRIGEFDDIEFDRRALDRITEEALAEGPSRGAQRQLELQNLEQAQAFDDLRRGQAGAQQQAFDALARQGGLSGGARERLARAGQRAQLIGTQGLRGQGAQQRLGILAQDEQAKRQLLGAAQQGALAAGQFEQANRQFEAQRRQFDITNALQELQSKRDAELRAFEADRKAAAAEKQAQAQARGSCFAEGTLVPMADGTYKKIEDITIDDSILVGGQVHTTVKSRIGDATPVFNYEGVLVTGNHAVLEGGKWVRVENSKKAVKFNGKIEIVYNLTTELHMIQIAGICFGDFEETDVYSYVTDEESLELMNRQLNEKVIGDEQTQPPLC